MTTRRILAFLAVGAVVGFSIFGAMVWRVTTVERIGSRPAAARFEAIRDSIVLAPPILTMSDGRLERRPIPESAGKTEAVHRLHVLAYRGPERGLVRVSTPFWFLRLKMPAVQFVLRDTDVDLRDLGLTPKEMARYGPSVVIEERRPNADHVLIWTQ